MSQSVDDKAPDEFDEANGIAPKFTADIEPVNNPVGPSVAVPAVQANEVGYELVSVEDIVKDPAAEVNVTLAPAFISSVLAPAPLKVYKSTFSFVHPFIFVWSN